MVALAGPAPERSGPIEMLVAAARAAISQFLPGDTPRPPPGIGDMMRSSAPPDPAGEDDATVEPTKEQYEAASRVWLGASQETKAVFIQHPGQPSVPRCTGKPLAPLRQTFGDFFGCHLGIP